MLAIRRIIHIRKSHEGLFHKDLDASAGHPIPAARREEALHPSNPVVRKRGQFAEEASHFHHSKKAK